MIIKNVFLISILLLSVNTAFAKDDRYDSSEVDAVIEVLTVKYENEFNYKFCRDKAGSYGYKYDYIIHIWELKNRNYIQLSETIFSNLPSSRTTQIKKNWENNKEKILSDRKNIDNDGNGQYCSQYFSHFLDGTIGKLDVPKTKLKPKLGSKEDVRILQRNRDMEVGCIKRGYNNDVKQFSATKKSCNCTIALMVRKMSNEDIDDYLTLASSKNPQDALKYIRKRISDSEIQACHM